MTVKEKIEQKIKQAIQKDRQLDLNYPLSIKNLVDLISDNITQKDLLDPECHCKCTVNRKEIVTVSGILDVCNFCRKSIVDDKD